LAKKYLYTENIDHLKIREQITNINNQVHKNKSFLDLFYLVLFKPKQSFTLIKELRSSESEKLFCYALLILLLAALGLASWENNSWSALVFLFVWFWNVSSVVLFAWLFSSKEETKQDIGLFFLLSAISQEPLLFLGICQIWFKSLGISIFGLFIFLWSIFLWVWSIKKGLNLSKTKSLIITFLFPFLLLVALFTCFVYIFVYALLSSFLN